MTDIEIIPTPRVMLSITDPTIGKHRLDGLQPEHVEHLYAVLLASGLSAGTVHHVRRTLNKALNDAVRRRRLPRNPVTLAHTPRYDPPEIEPLTVDEARRILAAAESEPKRGRVHARDLARVAAR